MYLFYWGGGDEWGGCVQLPLEEKHNSSTWPKGLALRQQSQTLYSKQICYVSDCQIREFYSFPSGWFQLFAKGWFGDNMERVKTFFWTRKKSSYHHHISSQEMAACLCGSGLFVPPAVPPEASQPGVPGGFSAGSRFSETPPEPLGFSDTAGGPMTSRAERLLGRRRVGGVVQYFLETLVLTTSQRLRS